MGWFTSFLYSQLLVSLPKPTKDFTGQTIIVTGSNTGLGLEAARHFSHLNAERLILAVRTVTKGEAAKASILESTGRPAESIEIWHLDLQSYDSIRAFVAKVNKLDRLDAVLENAGLMSKYFKMVSGYESVVGTNVISTFLMALMILPKMKESAAKFNIKPRLSIVASDLHFVAKFPERDADDIFAELNKEPANLAMERYAVTKLIEVFGVRELDSLLRKGSKSGSPEIIVNCMTPGACRSDFDRESTGLAKLSSAVMMTLIARTTEVGSRALVASIVAGEESCGSYMADCEVVEPSAFVESTEGAATQKKVWAQLLRELESIQPGVSQNI